MPLFPPRESLRGLSEEEKAKAIEKWAFDRRQQKLRSSEERGRLMGTAAWMHLLRVNEAQWKIIEPRDDKVRLLYSTAHARALTWRHNDKQGFHWFRHSEGAPLIRAKAPDEMTEGEKLADELVDLLDDPNSTDEQIRKKIDALQGARENARKAMPEAKRELARVLTTPRQEAVFLIRGWID